MKTIAGAAARAFLKRSRTRAAPTPTIASMNSEAEMEKNGTAGLAGDRAGEQRLAGSRGADEQDAFRHRAAETLVLLGFLEEVDDLDELGLDLIDPGDIREGRVRALRVIQARAALSEPSEHAARSATRRATRFGASGR